MVTLVTLWGASALALPPVDEPVRTGARAPEDAAVVVGIEDYFILPDVPFATRDANAFYAFLLYTRGIPADRVELLDRGANREQMLKAARDAGSRTKAGGRVWVYFSGHGAASPDTGERVLLGVDVQSDLDTFRSRSVAVSELREAAGAGGAEVLLVLDTCYSGRGRGGADLIGGKRFAVPSWAGETAAKVSEWSAAGPDEWSGPLQPARHGAFTYLVLGALRGWADGQRDGKRDGVVTLEEAHLYVQEGLRSLGLNDQRPVLVGDLGWSLSAGKEAAPELSAVSPAPAPSLPPAPVGQPGEPGQLQLTVMAAVAVMVDGGLLDERNLDSSGRLVVDGLSPGPHRVEVLNMFGKPITTLEVEVRPGEQVRLQYRKKKMTEIGRGPRVAVTPPSQPPSQQPPPPSPAMAPSLVPQLGGIQAFLLQLQQATFSEDQLVLLQQMVVTGFRPSSAEVGLILDAFSHSDHRVQAVRILAPSITDPENVEQILAHCTFSEEKRQIREVVAAHAKR